MERQKMIKTFSILGDCMRKWGKQEEKEAFNPFVAVDFFEKMERAIVSSKSKNGWFSEDFVRMALLNFGEQLTVEKLTEWLAEYPSVESPRKVGLILAGNIPMVGLHDILSVLLSGNYAMVKLSRDDEVLIPILMDIAIALQPEIKDKIEFVARLNDAEAIIATGSDNTARYFEKYFQHLPRIIRKNRTSIAVINGEETKEELENLGKDLFDYYGLGCRNVTHLVLPKGYDLNNIFGAIIGHSEIINNNKYGNNYDYYKAIFLMNQERITENGFVLMRESTDLFSPIAVLQYHFYESKEEVKAYLEEHQEKIQMIVGKEYEPFGSSQCPALDDYADGVNTMAFLTRG